MARLRLLTGTNASGARSVGVGTLAVPMKRSCLGQGLVIAMTLMQNVEAATSGALSAVKDESPEVKAAVVSAAATSAAALPAPPLKDVAVLWYLLIGGLVVVLLVALGGIVWTVADGDDKTSPDVIVTIFSSALAALIGLFVKSPTSA